MIIARANGELFKEENGEKERMADISNDCVHYAYNFHMDVI